MPSNRSPAEKGIDPAPWRSPPLVRRSERQLHSSARVLELNGVESVFVYLSNSVAPIFHVALAGRLDFCRARSVLTFFIHHSLVKSGIIRLEFSRNQGFKCEKCGFVQFDPDVAFGDSGSVMAVRIIVHSSAFGVQRSPLGV
jgi:hypothetical protein